ncbi:MAG: thioredoxin family protein [Deltaproteobacteria bacterium]|nr:thioredoxin family protein [Deltaproteobacteria bacterium]
MLRVIWFVVFGILLGEIKLGEKVDFSKLNIISWDGNTVPVDKLSNGILVMEWTNFSCPYVRKHYDSGNMQKLQKQFKDKATWVTILSSAKGKEGHLDDNEIKSKLEQEGWSGAYFVKDSDGKLGKFFEAKTTPHIFILKDGVLVYRGAIDSIPSSKPKDIERATNYVVEVLNSLPSSDFKPFETKAYGCSVKY